MPPRAPHKDLGLLDTAQRQSLAAENSPAIDILNTPYYRPPKGHKVDTAMQGKNKGKRILVPTSLQVLQDEFIEQLGSAEEIKLALCNDENNKVQTFLAALLNPKFSKLSVAGIAKRCGISALDLANALRRQATAKTMHTIITGMPQVAQDVVEDAKSTRVVCTRCDGYGVLEDRTPEPAEDSNVDSKKKKAAASRKPVKAMDCPQCEGTGWQRKPGDSDSRKLMFESVGLTGRKGSTIINNGNMQVNNVESVIDELDRLMDPKREQKQLESGKPAAEDGTLDAEFEELQAAIAEENAAETS